jgi:hypothetical protein
MKTLKTTLFVALSSLVLSCESNTYDEIGLVTNPTYEKNVKDIMSTNCTNCHSSNGTRSYSPLEDYQTVKDSCITGTILCRIEGNTCNLMPSSNKLPQVTIDLINRWKDQGYPEN